MIDSVIKPAEELKNTSMSVTNALIDAFMSTTETRMLYVDLEVLIANKLQELAEGGFYDTTNITLCTNQVEEWAVLSELDKEILRHILLSTLIGKGYKVEDVSKHSQQLVFRISF